MAIDGYGHWLAWLDRTGQLDPTTSAASRATREHVQAYADAAAGRLAPMTVQTRINELGRSLRAIAPGQDWTWISRAADRLRSQAVPVRQKRPRMQDARIVVELGIDMMQRAQASDPHFAVQRAVLYRDGLIIALLAYRPLRMRSFAALTLDQHLVRRGKAWWMVLGGADTKTRKPMEMPFPQQLVDFLELYLEQFRPALLIGRPKPGLVRPATSALWIGKGGRMMGPDAITFQIRHHTKVAFGVSINPLLFRDICATSIAIEDPEHARMVAAILGHATLATSERHYNQAQTLEASRRHQASVKVTRREIASQLR
ncbi:MAG: hypothetical protein ACRYG8_05880 [Janthinobacterium lividum]